MTLISVDKSIFEDLLGYKLRHLAEDIEIILKKWNYCSANRLLEDSRTGKLKEAEINAIELHQLVSDQNFLLELQDKILQQK